MKKSWAKYRLIIVVLIVLVIFFFRNIYPLLKEEGGPSSPPNQNTNHQLDRNINNLILTKHAKCRMDCRDISEDEIKEILHDGKINYAKSNLNDQRGPTYALEGYSNDKQHLRIIFAPEKERIVVVTCIDLDKEWQCDCN